MKKIFFFVVLALFSCKDYGNPASPEGNPDYGDIQTIFNMNCTACHYSGSSYISYESYNNVISGGSVIAGDAISSSLYDRITRLESAQGDMPPTGRLSQSNIDLIYEWINDGASD